MNKAVDEIIEMIELCKERNVTQLNVDKVLEYLLEVKEMDADTEQSDISDQYEKIRYAAECELNKEQYRARCESGLEMFKSIILSGQNALRTGLLINGGAAVAILAFIGNIAGKHDYMIVNLAQGLKWFSIGTLTVGLASFLTYITQRFYGNSEKPKDKWAVAANLSNWLVAVLGVIAVVFFCYGVKQSYLGITSKIPRANQTISPVSIKQPGSVNDKVTHSQLIIKK